MLKMVIPRELSLLIVAFLVAAVVMYWPLWSIPTNIDEYSDKYSKSQYILGTQSTAYISDSELYVYAAHAYGNGEDPTTVNFEHPPLAKYIYAVSLKLFENVYIINLLLFSLTLVALYHFAVILVKNNWIRVAICAIFIIQPIIYSQMQYVLLDIPITLFTLLLFIVLQKSWKSSFKQYLVAGIILGVIAAIKYPFPFIFIPSGIIGLVAWREKKYGELLVSYASAGLVYLLSYTVYFSHGHSIMEFIAFEKYRFVWWTGDRTIPKFLIFPNLFFGQHKSWWDDSIQYTKEWNIFLPAIFVGFMISLRWIKREFWFVLITAFGLGMLVVLGLGSASSLRYLTLLLPFWLTIIGSAVEQRVFTNKKAKK